MTGDDSAAFSINASSGAVTLTGNPDFETKSSYNFTVVATDAAQNSSEQAVSLAIQDVDETPPTLISSTPSDSEGDVPLDANIVLDFSENVLAGSGNITIDAHGGGSSKDLTIPVNSSQVTISGNQVTINPTDDLDGNTTYTLRIDSGAFTDAAGNGNSSSTLNFETAPIFGEQSGLALASTDADRTFESPSTDEISVRAVGNDATSSAVGAADIWSGAANLGSDDRVALAGNGVDFRDPEAPAIEMSLTEAAIAWQSSAGADPGHAQVSLANATVPDASIFDGGGHANIISFVNLPLTTQGLV